MRLAATPVAARVSATVQTVLELAEFERSWRAASCSTCKAGRSTGCRCSCPSGSALDRVSAPGEFQYAVTRQDSRPLLTSIWPPGQAGDVPVLLRASCRPLATGFARKRSSAAAARSTGRGRQQGDVAVQVDPAFDVDAGPDATANRSCWANSTAGSNPAQRPLARLGLHYTAGRLRRRGCGSEAPRGRRSLRHDHQRPRDRPGLEETILLDFTIQNAGIRRTVVPVARWNGRQPDQRAHAAAEDRRAGEQEPGSPVRVRIELQDEVMGQLRVLVENDRLLTPGSHEAPIPVVESEGTGGPLSQPPLCDDRNTGPRRSGGRGGQAAAGWTRWAGGKTEWETLKGVLGGRDDDGLSGLARRPASRGSPSTPNRTPAVATVKAGIGLAETTLVLDAAGAYRGQAGPRRGQRHRAVPGNPAARGRPSCGRPAWPASRSSRRRSPARPVRGPCGFR